jgi:hypothetical protein
MLFRPMGYADSSSARREAAWLRGASLRVGEAPSPVSVIFKRSSRLMADDRATVKDDSLTDAASLLPPDQIAAQIVERLSSALEKFEAVAAELAGVPAASLAEDSSRGAG